jgi:hypothetical protein
VHLRVGVPSVLLEHALARPTVEPRLPVAAVLAVDDDATVFIMLNRIVAGWMIFVVLASKEDPTVGDGRLANGALASTLIVLVQSPTTPPAEEKVAPAGGRLRA